MTYQIVTADQVSSSLWPIFSESYRGFLGDQTEAAFAKLPNDNFAVSVLQENDQVVAFSYHREVHLTEVENPPPYLQNLPLSFLQEIVGPQSFLTIEWMTVNPERLGRFTKVQPVDLILGLGLRLMKENGFRATLGISRQDNRTDVLVERFGGLKRGNVSRFGVDCSVMLIPAEKIVPHPISKTQQKIDELWRDRNVAPDLKTERWSA